MVIMSCYEREPLTLYLNVFQQPFLRGTYDFYRASASTYLAELPTSQYISYALEAIDQEQTRCDQRRGDSGSGDRGSACNEKRQQHARARQPSPTATRENTARPPTPSSQQEQAFNIPPLMPLFLPLLFSTPERGRHWKRSRRRSSTRRAATL